jgi:hypothetical protein
MEGSVLQILIRMKSNTKFTVYETKQSLKHHIKYDCHL